MKIIQSIIDWYYLMLAKMTPDMTDDTPDEVTKAVEELQEKAEPLKATATVTYGNSAFGRAWQQALNYPKLFNFFRSTFSKTKVWIYNVSEVEHELQHPAIGIKKVPARIGRKEYAVFGSLPSVVKWLKWSDCDDSMYTFEEDGRRVAMDIINPNNLGLDQNHNPDPVGYACSAGNDHGVKGLFWSERNPPLKKEVVAARKRLAIRYKFILEQMGVKTNGGIMTFGDKIDSFLKKGYSEESAIAAASAHFDITPEHHAAADFFRIVTEWHPVKLATTKKRKRSKENVVDSSPVERHVEAMQRRRFNSFSDHQVVTQIAADRRGERR